MSENYFQTPRDEIAGHAFSFSPAGVDAFTTPPLTRSPDYRRSSSTRSSTSSLDSLDARLMTPGDFPFPPTRKSDVDDQLDTVVLGDETSRRLPSKAERLLGLAISPSNPEHVPKLDQIPSTGLFPSVSGLTMPRRLPRSTSTPLLRHGSAKSNSSSRRNSILSRVGLASLRSRDTPNRESPDKAIQSSHNHLPKTYKSAVHLSPDAARTTFYCSPDDEGALDASDSEDGRSDHGRYQGRSAKNHSSVDVSSQSASIVDMGSPATSPTPSINQTRSPLGFLSRRRQKNQRRSSAASPDPGLDQSLGANFSLASVHTYSHDALPPFPSKLCEFAPYEEASDLFCLHTLAGSSALRRFAGKGDWQAQYLILTSFPSTEVDDQTIHTLHLFPAQPIPSDRETHRLEFELMASSSVFVVDDAALLGKAMTLAGDKIIAALKVRGLQPIERDDLGRPLKNERKSTEWTLGIERTEQLSRWLKLLKNAVDDTRRAATDQSDQSEVQEGFSRAQERRTSVITISTRSSGGSSDRNSSSIWSDSPSMPPRSVLSDQSSYSTPSRNRIAYAMPSSRSPSGQLDELKEESVYSLDVDEEDALGHISSCENVKDSFGDDRSENVDVPSSLHPFAAAALKANAAAPREFKMSNLATVAFRERDDRGSSMHGIRASSTSLNDLSARRAQVGSTRPVAIISSSRSCLPALTAGSTPAGSDASVSSRRLSVATFATTATNETSASLGSTTSSSSASLRSRLSTAPLPPPATPLPPIPASAAPSSRRGPMTDMVKPMPPPLPPPPFALGALPPPPVPIKSTLRFMQ